MSRSRSRLAADWFGRFSYNSSLAKTENSDITDKIDDSSSAVADSNIDTVSASKLTGALPAIDGSNLTGIEGVPSGVITMWSGSAGAIPSGWNLCDGTNSTPNLVGKFIKGGSTAGTTGGSSTHSHSHSLSAGSHTLSTSQMPSHNHSTKITGFGGGQSGTGGSNTTSSKLYGNATNLSTTTGNNGSSGSHAHSLSGSIADGSNEPAYYELCYIMKS